MGFYDSSDHQIVFRNVLLTTSIVSSFVSVVMIVLMHKMKILNGHLLLVSCMTWSQFIYDISFYPVNVSNSNYELKVISSILQLIGGIAVSIFSNIMSIIILYVITFRKSVDVFKNFKWYCICVVLATGIEVILYIMSVADSTYTYLNTVSRADVYYYFRIISIIFNFIVSGIAYGYVYRIQHNNTESIAMKAICILAQRIQMYPLVQAVSRSGITWYEKVYGWGDFDPPIVTQTQFSVQIYFAIITPVASIGYLISFLVLQPLAYRKFIEWFIRPEQQFTSSFFFPTNISDNTPERGSINHTPAGSEVDENVKNNSVWEAMQKKSDYELFKIIDSHSLHAAQTPPSSTSRVGSLSKRYTGTHTGTYMSSFSLSNPLFTEDFHRSGSVGSPIDAATASKARQSQIITETHIELL